VLSRQHLQSHGAPEVKKRSEKTAISNDRAWESTLKGLGGGGGWKQNLSHPESLSKTPQTNDRVESPMVPSVGDTKEETLAR